MPKVSFQGQTIEVETGARLRDALRSAGLSPHNGNSAWFNCTGLGTCGTCAVRVRGRVEPETPRGREQWRLGFPPHEQGRGLRLACQVRVMGDLDVEKLEVLGTGRFVGLELSQQLHVDTPVTLVERTRWTSAESQGGDVRVALVALQRSMRFQRTRKVSRL